MKARKVYLAASEGPEGTLVGLYDGRGRVVRLHRGLGVHAALVKEVGALQAQGLVPVVAQTSVARKAGALLPEGEKDHLGLAEAREALENLRRVQGALEGARKALAAGRRRLAEGLLEAARYWAQVCPGLPEGAVLESEGVRVEAV